MSRFDDRVERLVNKSTDALRDEVYSLLKDSDPRPGTGVNPADLSVVLNLLQSNNQILNQVKDLMAQDKGGDDKEEEDSTQEATSEEEKVWRDKVDEKFNQLLDDVSQLTDSGNNSSVFNIDNWKRMLQELEDENPNGARATDNIRRMHDFLRGCSNGGLLGGLMALGAGEVKRWLGRNWEKCIGALKDIILTAQIIGVGKDIDDIRTAVDSINTSCLSNDRKLTYLANQGEAIVKAIEDNQQCCAANTQLLENVIYPAILDIKPSADSIPNKEILATKPDINVLSAKVDDLIRRLR